MAVFKCKMCGGNLEVADNMSVCECEYCGTKQTVPKTRDDIVFNLFNRANNLRIKCEFDKAQEIYEKIVASNPDEAEAYWGIVLCKYGIEYVEDPATFKKVPTCHRTQLESVMTDVDYLAAIEHADVVQQSIYESEARNIDILQKNILEIVHNEKPFDVFICYKETNENGRRTNDSVIANDIYYQLTTEGFKVFYAAITLEDKIGQEYEPYIFAALNSAKVMLVIGSKPEYFTAVWVKNEWSRYMKLMKTDRSKLLIPCYKDMDAYDLPEEFSHLQAQNMSKIGFINDVIRGIRKVLSKDDTAAKNATPVQQITTATVSTNLENMLKRGMLALEDEKWEDADNFFEQVLNENVEEPRAYIGKMLSSLKAKSEDGLIDSAPIKAISLENNEYFKKACRFAGEELKAHLVELNNRYLFSSGMKRFNSAITEDNYIDAKAVFDKMSNYQPAKEQAEKCKIKAADCVYRNADEILSTSNNKNQLSFAKHEFLRIKWHKDSENRATQCDNKIKQIEDDEKDAVYQNAIKVVTDDNSTESQLREALSILKKMSGWKMADSVANTCNERLKAIEKAIEIEKEQERIEQEKEMEKENKRISKLVTLKKAIIIAALCIIILFVFGISNK